MSAKPHGCSLVVDDDLVVTFQLREETQMTVAGHWMLNTSAYRELETLKVTATRDGDTLQLELDGEMEYMPNTSPYRVKGGGKVAVHVCPSK